MPTGVYVRTKVIRKALMKHKLCKIKGCNEKHYGRGLCENHWQKQYQVEYQKQYRGDNKKKIAKRVKQWREDNPKRNKQWFQDNREHRKKYKNQYNINNKVEIAIRAKQYRQTPAGKMAVKAGRHNRRTLLKGLTKETIQRVYEDNIKKFGTLTCCLCFKPIEFGEDSLEHKTPLTREGTNEYENLGIAHYICNIKKHTMTLSEWFNKMKKKEKL